MIKDILPKIGDVKYVTTDGQYLGANLVHGDAERKLILSSLAEFRGLNELPGVDPKIFQPCELILYININSTLTVLYPEDHQLEH